MNKIKILYGLEAAGGGALKHLVYLVTHLNRSIFDITVILSNSRGENIEDKICVMENTGAKVLIWSINRNINIIKDVWILIKLVSFIKHENFDIVHAHSSKAGCIFRLASRLCKRRPTFYTPHCFYFQGKTGFTKLFFVMLERYLAKITTGIIVSEGEKKAIINNKITSDGSKILNINNSIDFNEYRQSTDIVKTKKKFGIKNAPFIVGAIGRLVYQKDWETYIYAAQEVLKVYPDTVFLIVGEGELHKKIQKLIYKLELENKIILTGYIKEIHTIYGLIDVLVNTSLWEGLPYIFLEAMRYGKPIVATNTGNENVIINGKTGYLTDVKDYISIADKIISLIRDKSLKHSMGRKGNISFYDKYSFEFFVSQHESLYLKSLKRSIKLF